MSREAAPGFMIQSGKRKGNFAVLSKVTRLAVQTVRLLKVNPITIPQMLMAGLAARNQVQISCMKLPAIKCAAAWFCLPKPFRILLLVCCRA